MDTPGVIPYQVGHKFGASKEFLTDPQRSLMEAELGACGREGQGFTLG